MATSLAGVAVAVNTYQVQPRTVTSIGRAGDLTLELHARRWVAHEMHGMPGMEMAGMPAAGSRRLHVEMSMSNRGQQPRSFGPDQFRVESTDGRWGLKSSSFVTGALGPGQTMTGDLFFDVPEQASKVPLRLAWMPPGRDLWFRLGDTDATEAEPNHHGEGRDRP